MRSLTSPRAKRISGSKKFRASPKKDFFNTIRQKRSFGSLESIPHDPRKQMFPDWPANPFGYALLLPNEAFSKSRALSPLTREQRPGREHGALELGENELPDLDVDRCLQPRVGRAAALPIRRYRLRLPSISCRGSATP
jgi:hypothetical protein